MSVDDFYSKMLCNQGNDSMETHYREKGELNITTTEWAPSEEVYEDLKVLETRTIDYEVQLKNNPFVKKVPTLKTFKLIERTSELLKIRSTNKTRQVMYCDCFFIDEEWIVV